MSILSGNQTCIRIVLFGLFLNIGLYVSGQLNPVRIDIAVMPPYTSSINDYINTPNKVVASITHLGLTRSGVDVYLKGSITSDGGIHIQTSQSFKPSSPIHIDPGMVYNLTPDNISELFDINKIDVKGIDINSLLNGAGLPEDNYRICIRAFDYNTNQPVSEEHPLGCSNYFMVTNLEPPIVLQPFCGDSLSVGPVQSMPVSWSIPPGSMGAQYKFEMIEIPEGITMNPNNAFQSQAFPVVVDEITNVNFINITTDKALLTTNYTYVFRIQAIDPINNLCFRNEGYSEICYFTVKEEDIPKFQNNLSGTENGYSDLAGEFEYVPTTTISGRLLAKFPDNPNDKNTLVVLPENFGQDEKIEVDPENFFQDKTIIDPLSNNDSKAKQNEGTGHSYSSVSEISTQIRSDITSNNKSFGGMALVNKDNIMAGLQLVERKPYYYFADKEEITNTKPLANMNIRLVARFAVGGPTRNGLHPAGIEPVYRDPYSGELIEGLTDLNGNTRSGSDILNVVLATATTDENGNYSFIFNTDFYTAYAGIRTINPGHFEEEQVHENPLDRLQWGMDEIFPGAGVNILEEIANDGVVLNENGVFNVDLAASSAVMHQQNDLLGGQNHQAQGGMQTRSYVPGQETYNTGYICLKIEVVNEKFCSPDIDIFAMPGDILDVPNQVAKLKTYNLTVKTVTDNTECQELGKNKPMDNIKVHVYRKMGDVSNEVPLIIDYEGHKLESQIVNEDGSFKNVAIDTTNQDGYVYIKNLVKHADFDPQYFLDIKARDYFVPETDYEFTAYNYKSVYRSIDTDEQTDATYKLRGSHVMYNRHFMFPDEVVIEQVMIPNKPEIKGRVMAKTNFQNVELPDTRIELRNDNQGIESTTTCLEDGFFRFTELDVICEEDVTKGPPRRILISHPGYSQVLIPQGTDPWYLKYGSLKDVKDINMTSSTNQKGYIEDEEGNPVSAYVKSEFSPYYITTDSIISGVQREFFDVPTIYGQAKIFIEPKSSQYFKSDTIADGEYYLKVKVYKKLHRPKILVVNKHGEAISGAKISLGEEEGKVSDPQGYASFKFASPGDQYIIKIEPQSGYAPLQKSINIPVTRHDTIIKFVMEEGRSIHGTVVEKESKEPLSNAIVYTELENTDGTKLYLETESSADGNYFLKGIPRSINSIEVFAVKESKDPSYIGDSKTITFSTSITMMPQNKSYDFELKRTEDWDLSSIWGYPVAISALRQVKGNPEEYFIDGYFYNPPCANGIELQQDDLKLNFNFLKVKKSSSGKIEPVDNTIPLDNTQMPLYVNQTFTGILYNYKKTSFGSSGLIMNYNACHEINKEAENATLEGMLKLNLNTFRFAYHFNGELYAGNKDLGNKIQAFSKTVSNQQSQLTNGENTFVLQNTTPEVNRVETDASMLNSVIQPLNIFSLNSNYQPVPIQGYEVFDFPASSKPDGAYLLNNKIRIPTILHTSIPSCNTCPNLDIHLLAGNIEITKDNINLVESPNDTLQFDIENWKVINQKEWKFDKNEEAIVLKEARIITGKGFDVKIKDLKIRYNSIGEGELDVKHGSITLGGFAKVDINEDLDAVFNYDVTGHYRISFVGETSSDKPAGIVEQLPAMKNNERIKFESIGLMSNGRDIMTINQNIRFYDIVDMQINQIVSGNGYFDLIGNPDFDIPNYSSGQATMRYSNTTGEVKPEFRLPKASIEPPGYVTFFSDPNTYSFAKGEFTSYGTLIVSPGMHNNPDAFSFEAKLTHTKNECHIELETNNQNGNQIQNFYVGESTFSVFEGGLTTINNNEEWSLFNYKAYTDQIDGLNKEGANNIVDFTVFGAIEASSSSLEVTNIDVGIGAMELTYDFAEQRLHGGLEIRNIELGYAYLNSGYMGIMFDKNGYYLAGKADATIYKLFPVSLGFIIGSSDYVHPTDEKMIAESFHNKYKPKLGSIHGFYSVAEYRALNINKQTPVKLLKLHIQAGLGQYFEAGFDTDNKKVEIGGYIYGDAYGGISTKICDAGIGLYINGVAKGTYYLDSKILELYACTDGGIKVSVCGIGKSFDFYVDAKGWYDGDFHLDMTSGWEDCP
jgi:TANFOR domain-containing protein